ncbi:MAG: (2Fe-2S)-binding protein [Solirubrobacterales bacterium]|nr:(2Fe-2S)-binding protein [Solirubrobacterales bacterium]
MVDAGTVQAIEFTINGEKTQTTVESRQLLVHFIRDTLGMKGTHVGCDTGSCGACSVIVDGKLVKSCMMLAPQADGAEIETIEGLARDGELTPVQQAFHEQHGLQCGYCTPGIVMAATFLLRRREGGPPLTEEEIRRSVRGNICRCTGYVNILRSIEAAAKAAGVGVEEAA